MTKRQAADPTSGLGDVQCMMLRLLRERGSWSRGGWWTYGSYSYTERVLESLVRRGLVERIDSTVGSAATYVAVSS